MHISKQINKNGMFCRATSHQRICAVMIFLGAFVIVLLLWLAAIDKINIGFFLGPCGFKQRYGLPCPTCGITTAAIAFFHGEILAAFYIQPAGALFCVVIFFTAILSFLIAVFGIYSVLLSRFFDKLKVGYVILAIMIIVAAGWAVTLARALAEKNT